MHSSAVDADGELISDQIDYWALYMAQRGLCFYCRVPMAPQKQQKGKHERFGWSRDHFDPKQNGNGIPGNVVLAHPPCNNAKGDREPMANERWRFEMLMRSYDRWIKVRQG